MTNAEITYLLVDGENIDATLGNGILGGIRPRPDQRPRWERVREYAARIWGVPCKGLFFLNASSGVMPGPFVQMLLATGYKPIPLAGSPDEKVVDLAVLKTLDALRQRPGHVLLASHDSDFAPALGALIDGQRKVGVIGFREFISSSFRDFEAKGLEQHDLESGARAFEIPLPRVRIIPIAEFDPAQFL